MRQNSLRRIGLAVATVAAMAGPAAACTVDIPFANGSSALSSQARTFLDGFAQQNPGRSINLVGYASPDGSAAANLALSQARAQSVGNYLSQASGGSINVASQAVGESADIGRTVRLSARRCVLPSGEVLAGGAGAAGGGAAGALGALSPAVAAGFVVGALALGAALSGAGDNNTNGTPGTGSTGTTGTTGTSGTSGTN